MIAVYTGHDFPDLKPMPFGGGEGGGVAGSAPIDTPVLPTDKVLHVGQAIAVVVAEDRYIAADAAALIEVDYEPLPVVTDLEASIKDGAPQIYDNVPNNVAYTAITKNGQPDEEFANAEVTVTQRMNNQRVSGVSMETRGAMAYPRPASAAAWSSSPRPRTRTPSARRSPAASASANSTCA